MLWYSIRHVVCYGILYDTLDPVMVFYTTRWILLCRMLWYSIRAYDGMPYVTVFYTTYRMLWYFAYAIVSYVMVFYTTYFCAWCAEEVKPVVVKQQ